MTQTSSHSSKRLQLDNIPTRITGVIMKLRSTLAVVPALLLAIAFLNTSRASADIVFDLTTASPNLLNGLGNGDTVTSNGITLTFSNVVVSDGSATGDVENVGILLSSTDEAGLQDVHSFDFSFSHDVVVSQYTIGAREDVHSNSVFVVTRPNGTSGNNVIPAGSQFTDSVHTFDEGTIPFLQAGQVYSFSHNLPNNASDDPLFNLRSFSVTAVPEPSSASLLLMGALGLVVCRVRKRQS